MDDGQKVAGDFDEGQMKKDSAMRLAHNIGLKFVLLFSCSFVRTMVP
jgi:hypothetical protein